MQLKQTYIAHGFLTGLIMVVIAAGIYAAKLNIKMSALGLTVWVVFIVGIIMNAVAFSKANGGNITFGQAFASCMMATLIISLLFAAWTAASHYIFPNIEMEEMEEARRRLQERGMSEQMIDRGMKVASMFTGPIIKTVASAFFCAIGGTIISLIAAAVAKKNPQPPQMM